MAAQTSIPLDLEDEKDKYFERVDGQLVERELGGGTHSDFLFRLLSLLKPLAATTSRPPGMVYRPGGGLDDA